MLTGTFISVVVLNTLFKGSGGICPLQENFFQIWATEIEFGSNIE